jgi:hypothetical protein
MGAPDGVRYIITGGGGAEIGSAPVRGDFHHYVWVTAPPAGQGEARLAVIRTGSVERQDVVTTALREAWAQVANQLETGAMLLLDDETSAEAVLRLHNPFGEPLVADVEFRPAAGWDVLPERAEASVPPQETAEFRFSLTARAGEMEDDLVYRVRFSAGENGELQREYTVVAKTPVPCIRKSGVTVDGSLDEWAGEATISIGREEQVVLRPHLWGGPEACSGVAWLGRDAENLYVAVRITDPSLKAKPETGHVANGDSIEIYLDGRPEAQLGKREYAEGVTYLVIVPALRAQAARVLYQEAEFTELEGVRLASRLIAGGYEMEVAIPLGSFPECGDLIGFDLAINDNSDPGGRVQLLWHGTVDDWEDASAFGLVDLRGD